MQAEVRPLRRGDPVTLGRYDVLGLLGVGGQACVYLGRGGDGDLVAIKVPNPQLRAGRLGHRMLADEADAVGRVLSCFTAELLEAQVDGVIPFMVTAFIDAPSLHGHVTRAGPLERPALDELAAGTLIALLEIHSCGLVHHDVKPGNVLLAPDGPRLVDFGATRAAGLISPGAYSSQGVLVTPAFMAPELLHEAPVLPAADIFSWASTMVFAATGRGPFHDPQTARLLDRLQFHPPDLSGVPDALVPVLRTCLAKNPADRPTASGALDALLAALARADATGAGVVHVSSTTWAALARPHLPHANWECLTEPLSLPA